MRNSFLTDPNAMNSRTILQFTINILLVSVLLSGCNQSKKKSAVPVLPTAEMTALSDELVESLFSYVLDPW